MKRIFITGSSGFLGRYLLNFAPRNVEILAQYRKQPVQKPSPHVQIVQIDFTNWDPAIIEDFRPQVIFHTAAEASIDKCDLHPEYSHQVNYEATARLAELAKKIGARFIFTSSDVIFDGKRGNYQEKDPPNPLNCYAQQKVAAENFIREHLENYVIVRPALIYGRSLNGRPSFTEVMFRNLKQDKPVYLFTDQYRTPVLVNNLAASFWQLAKNDFRGILHVGGNQKLSRYEMGEIMCRLFNFSTELLIPIESTDANQVAPRPRDCSLNISLAKKILSISLTDYQQGLSIAFQ